jgi:hypothetical protein
VLQICSLRYPAAGSTWLHIAVNANPSRTAVSRQLVQLVIRKRTCSKCGHPLSEIIDGTGQYIVYVTHLMIPTSLFVIFYELCRAWSLWFRLKMVLPIVDFVDQSVICSIADGMTVVETELELFLSF